MLIGFPPIFMADTKIIYGYNFAAALTCRKKKLVQSKPLQQRLFVLFGF